MSLLTAADCMEMLDQPPISKHWKDQPWCDFCCCCCCSPLSFAGFLFVDQLSFLVIYLSRATVPIEKQSSIETYAQLLKTFTRCIIYVGEECGSMKIYRPPPPQSATVTVLILLYRLLHRDKYVFRIVDIYSKVWGEQCIMYETFQDKMD